jgi:Uma2 family endonuclease
MKRMSPSAGSQTKIAASPPVISPAQKAVQHRLPRHMTSPPPYPIRRFSVAEYDQIARAGILTEDDNVELLEGWIVPKMTKYPPHDSTIDLMAYLLNQLLPLGWYVRIQNSIVTTDSEPEPDLVVVRGKPGDYRERHPTGADIGLIVEVADSTVRRDRRKANIYARAGVPLYWIINLDERQIEIHSQASGEGKKAVYQSRQILRGDDDVFPLTLDGTDLGKLQLSEVLPASTGSRDGE